MTEESKVLGIYHTHSKFSKFNHGKDSVQDMCKAAREAGLVEYAITDHGPRHVFGIWKRNIKKLRSIVDKENEIEGTKILMGLELNLLGAKGETDYPKKDGELLDIRLVGMHKAGMVNIKNLFTFILPNLFNGKSKKVTDKNTNAYINAVKKYKIDIVTHPQEYIKVDLEKLANACVENNCYLEINNKHLKYTKEDFEKMLKTDVKFVLSSDAHCTKRVVSIENALKFALECGVTEDRIANLNKLPNFEKKY